MLTGKQLEDIARARVLVVGDAMLDRYWHGDVDRISPEAPVPVVVVRSQAERRGGAASVARSARALRPAARCSASAAMTARPTASNGCWRPTASVAPSEATSCSNTTVRTASDFPAPATHPDRFRVPGQQGCPCASAGRIPETNRCRKRRDRLRLRQGAGSVTCKMVGAARKAGNGRWWSIPRARLQSYHGATLIRPTAREFERWRAAWTMPISRKRARQLVNKQELGGLLITRGEEGDELRRRVWRTIHIPAQAREVYDVTGAGDTVIATIDCALAVDGDLEDALRLSNVAAGIVVSKLEFRPRPPDEIRHALAVQEV